MTPLTWTRLASWPAGSSFRSRHTRFGGIEAPDEEIRRTALACRFERRGGWLPTIDAVLGFLSVRLSALRSVDAYVESGDCGPDSGAEGAETFPAIALDLETYPVAALGAR